MRRKSQAISLFLTAVFGPLGVFYTSAWQAIVLFIAAIVVMGTPWFLTGLLVIWVLSIAVSASAVKTHNDEIDRKESIDERRHQELLEAARQR